MKALRIIAASLAVVLAAAGCSRTDSAQTGGTDRSGPGTLSWSGCDVGAGVECATLEVPLDWSEPEGTKITLALGRRTATGERNGILLMNPGGPGASGIALLSYHPGTASINDHFDRVSWDPRGVGRSTAMKCGSAVPELREQDPDPDDEAEQSALDQAAEQVADECATLDGYLLSHMTTDDTVRDLEAIRVALGSEPLNYLGFSYGTHIGQRYLELFPQNVDRMVLDGIVDPQESFTEFLLSQTAAFDRAFERQGRLCSEAGEEVCGVDDLLGAYDSLRQRVERKPLTATGGSIGPAALAIAGIQSGYQPDGWRILGPALSDALDGDGSSIRSIADSYQDAAGYGPYAAVVCSDRPTPRGPEEYREFAEEAMDLSPRFGGVIANEMLPCATWPVSDEPPVDEGLPGAGSTPVSMDTAPILIIGNTGDPATPFENARRVHSRIKNSVLITVQSDGHTSFGSDACVDRIVDDYLLRAEVPGSGARTCR